jgi:ABC-type glycerol-3-phosphate transport system substrate-binding protein
MRRTRLTRVSTLVLVAGLALGTSACASSSSGTAGSSTAPSPTSTVPNEAVVGMTQAQAEAWAKDHGFTVRVASVDGQPNPLTMDYRQDRINITLQNGTITSATIG